MEPYYEHSGITIYHGDCLEVLPTLEPVDAVIADPPYGIAYNPGGAGRGWTKGIKTFSKNDAVIGDNKPFDPAPWLAFPSVTLWGANHFADKLPASSHWLIWDKRQDGLINDFADCEMAWNSIPGPARMFRHLWNGAFRKSERGQTRVHPAQKPVALMVWNIKTCTDESDTILDPFMGSGTTLVAAKELGRKAIGIEICEAYCEIAAKRLSQEVFDFNRNNQCAAKNT